MKNKYKGWKNRLHTARHYLDDRQYLPSAQIYEVERDNPINCDTSQNRKEKYEGQLKKKLSMRLL